MPQRQLAWGFRQCRQKYSARTYNAHAQGPPVTYFQPPPQPPKRFRRVFTTILWSTTCFVLGAFASSWLVDQYAVDADEDGERVKVIQEALDAGMLHVNAHHCPPMTLELAKQLLETRSGYAIAPKAVGHVCHLPSNSPCEDHWTSGTYTFFNDSKRDWSEWAIFDGHAGPRTAQLLEDYLPSIVGEELWKGHCMTQPYIPNDWHTNRIIKKAFLQADQDIVEQSGKEIESDTYSRSEVLSMAAPAFSGSCALLALYDPGEEILRVANVGDSRAVLGQWDENSKKYVTKPMSVDQTGFNPVEVARLQRDHPGEDCVDPATGRVHGIAVSRAFGDARWKWTESLTRLAHEKFWGPTPRPEGLIKTPPYLTAEPEVKDIRIQTKNANSRPDFLIMASDGLWDHMSSEDAVECVSMWLDKNKPTDFLEHDKKLAQQQQQGLFPWGGALSVPTGGSEKVAKFEPRDPSDDVDTYYDEVEKCLKWRVSPKHFVVEDQNCGAHLVKNALGGKRRGLFTSVVTIQPPHSRNVRDDITVQVIFFGMDMESQVENQPAPKLTK